jgi:hypothetical protein
MHADNLLSVYFADALRPPPWDPLLSLQRATPLLLLLLCMLPLPLLLALSLLLPLALLHLLLLLEEAVLSSTLCATACTLHYLLPLCPDS